MKKGYLAATVTLALMGSVAYANTTASISSTSMPASSVKESASSSSEASSVVSPIKTSKSASVESMPGPATSAAAATTTEAPEEILNPPTAEFIARPGNRYSDFELDFMIPLYQQLDRLLFVDLRGMRDTKRNTEGNFGIGYRQIMKNRFILGAYIFGDYRRTQYAHNFTQLTFGAEILSHCVDGRFNGYLADSRRKFIAGKNTAQFTGFTIQTMGQYEQMMNGFDGEVGTRIPIPSINNIAMDNVEARVFAGGYYFARKGLRTIAGPRGRLEFRVLDVITLGSRLILGVDVSTDKVRKTNVFGNIGLRIPLQSTYGKKLPQGLQRRLADYVYRDVDVVGDVVTVNTGNLQRNGRDVIVYHVASTSTGDGSQNNPAADLSALPATFDIIHLVGGSYFAPPNSITLSQPGQQIIGDGATPAVMDERTGTVYTDLVPSTGLRPIIQGPPNVPAILISDSAKNASISGINYQNNANADSSFVNATFTTAGGNTFTISGVSMVGNTLTVSNQIEIDSLGAAVTTFSGEGISSFGLNNANATMINLVADQGGTLNGYTLNNNFSPSGAADGIFLNTGFTAGTSGFMTFIDTNGSYVNGGVAFAMFDQTTSLTQSLSSLTINSATIEGMAVPVVLFHDTIGDGTGNASNVNMQFIAQAVGSTPTTFSQTPTGFSDIVIRSTGGVGASGVFGNISVTLRDTIHDNSLGSTIVLVNGSQTVDPTTITLNASNVTGTGLATGANSAFLTNINNSPTGVNNPTGTFTYTFINTHLSNYVGGIIFINGGSAMTNLGIVQINISSEDNSINTAPGTFSLNVLGGSIPQPAVQVNAGTGFLQYNLNPAAPYESQFPNGIN